MSDLREIRALLRAGLNATGFKERAKEIVFAIPRDQGELFLQACRLAYAVHGVPDVELTLPEHEGVLDDMKAVGHELSKGVSSSGPLIDEIPQRVFFAYAYWRLNNEQKDSE